MSLFVKEEVKDAPDGARSLHDGRLFMPDAETADKYQFNVRTAAGIGTIVPCRNRTGGIEGGHTSSYGQIVPGHVITAGMDGTGEVAVEVNRPEHLEHGINIPREAWGDAQKVAKATKRTNGQQPPRLVRGGSTQQQNAEAIEELIETGPSFEQAMRPQTPVEPTEIKGIFQGEPPKDPDVEMQVPEPVVTAAPEYEAPTYQDPGQQVLPPHAPEVYRVVFKGDFGKFRGKYIGMDIQEELLILTHNSGAAVFSPPSSDQPFKLSCNEDAYQVYFFGIEFEMPDLNIGVQVFNLVEGE
jgi:hypothetical protein